jgi:hypothetical protein
VPLGTVSRLEEAPARPAELGDILEVLTLLA